MNKPLTSLLSKIIIKNLDVKTIVIICLAIFLIISVFFKRSIPIDQHKDEIKQLHTENVILSNRVDSLKMENAKLDSLYELNLIALKNSEIMLRDAQLAIDGLEVRRVIINKNTYKLSANEVSDEFNKFLKSKN